MMKHIGSTALALALAASVVPAAMAEDMMDIVRPSDTGYAATIAVNGEELDLSGIPAAEDGIYLLPMRVVTEADYGYAAWFTEENQGYFALDGHSIYVNFSDNSVEVDEEKLEDVTATVIDGVTFLPAGVIDSLEGYSVLIGASEPAFISISTPNGAPLTKLAREIINTTDMACSEKNSAETLKDFMGVDPANYDEFASFSSMMVQADALFIGKLAEGADVDAAKEELEAVRAGIQQSFEQYLPDPLEMAKNGKIVEKDGYVALFISPDVDKAIEMFEAAVTELNAAEAE